MPRAASLDDIRVVDPTRVPAGPSCTRTLADHGADVIEVEAPQGDQTRARYARRPPRLGEHDTEPNDPRRGQE